ncbi:MAG TPA: hypothetical protein PK402_02270, partial [Tepidisphaeraceae bacterium]|nr:hypothetical protein [Tepidisphaeraceae bacterium]
IACALIAPWIALEILSARSRRLNQDATSLMAVGALGAAEEKATQALRLFSLHRVIKLASLHQLAAIRHAQRKFMDSAKLAREVLSRGRSKDQALDRSTRLVLVDSLIELNEVDSAWTELGNLMTEPLSLRETLNARQLQVDLLGRRGAWRELVAELRPLVDLSELMPALASARTQAWLALAARECAMMDWSNLLRERAELLADYDQIVADRPLLQQLWSKPAESNPPSLPNSES